MKPDINKMSSFLPIGYLFLMILGVIKESLTYRPIGVDILNFSSTTDILLSPISDLTTTFIILPILVVGIILYYGLLKYTFNNREKKWFKKWFFTYNDEFWNRSEKEIRNGLQTTLIILIALFICGIYIGKGHSKGKRLLQEIQTETLKFNHVLTYSNSGQKAEISLIGANSIYCFYVIKGEKKVKISPITSIKILE